jgi:3-dehydroquinate synthetase
MAPAIEIAVEGGERVKTWERLGAILERAIEAGCGRQSAVVGIGGGATCDLTAMAASLLGRGAPLVLVPSTLLAQVDASVGGKTAINLGGRNLIGTFHPATDVVIDAALTRSQSKAEYGSGMAELFKMALIADSALFDEVVSEQRATPSSIARAVAHKARIAEADPKEAGLRKVLNLGHTLGHALETGSGYRMRHGEAVAVGIAAIARFSAARGWLSTREKARILEGLAQLSLPTSAPQDLLAEAGGHIKADKKGTADEIDLIAIRGVGNVTIERLPWSEVQSELVRCGGET